MARGMFLAALCLFGVLPLVSSAADLPDLPTREGDNGSIVVDPDAPFVVERTLPIKLQFSLQDVEHVMRREPDDRHLQAGQFYICKAGQIAKEAVKNVKTIADIEDALDSLPDCAFTVSFVPVLLTGYTVGNEIGCGVVIMLDVSLGRMTFTAIDHIKHRKWRYTEAVVLITLADSNKCKEG